MRSIKTERARLDRVVGKRVKRTEYNPKDEGQYTLIFEDGTEICFTSVGDDHTSTSFHITKKKS